MTLHHRTCNLCEANCGLLIETEGSIITSIRGDEADPLSEGYLCPKAFALKDLYEDPERLRAPLIREGGQWREVGWQEAVAAAAAGLHALQQRGGKSAVASYVGNPSAHNLPAMTALAPWLRLLGGSNRYSASSVDQFPKMLACYLLYGAQLSVPVPDVDRSDYMLILGANPVVSHGSLMTAPGMKRRLARLRKRGGKLLVIDPRRSETAAAADEHLFIRPGTDALFLAAVINAVASEGFIDASALERVEGVEHLLDSLSPFTAEAVEGATEIGASQTRRIAKEFATAASSVCYSRIGVCVQSYGTLVSYLSDALNIVCGRLDRPGGAMFSSPAVTYSSKGSYQRWKSRVRGLDEFGGELPIAVLAEEIETSGQGQVRGLFTMAGNPVLSAPNGARLEKAIAGLDFMVSVDPWMNETTCYADVILPPRHSLENPHYSIVFHKLAVRNTAKFCKPVFEPVAHALSEWEILGQLCAELSRLRNEDAVAAGAEEIADPTAPHFAMSPEMFVSMLLGAGPSGLTMDDLLEHPSGIDLGELESGGLDRAVFHDDGRVHLSHSQIDAELARLLGEFESGQVGGVGFAAPRDDSEFLMIGRRSLRSNNSWMHNCPSLMSGRDRCTLLMHPVDAGRLGLEDGRTVAVGSRAGKVEVRLEISDEVMEGVVSLPHGFGHGRPGTRLSVAAQRPGVSMNDLTDDAVTEGLVGNGILTGVPVRVSACAGAGS